MSRNKNTKSQIQESDRERRNNISSTVTRTRETKGKYGFYLLFKIYNCGYTREQHYTASAYLLRPLLSRWLRCARYALSPPLLCSTSHMTWSMQVRYPEHTQPTTATRHSASSSDIHRTRLFVLALRGVAAACSASGMPTEKLRHNKNALQKSKTHILPSSPPDVQQLPLILPSHYLTCFALSVGTRV